MRMEKFCSAVETRPCSCRVNKNSNRKAVNKNSNRKAVNKNSNRKAAVGAIAG